MEKAKNIKEQRRIMKEILMGHKLIKRGVYFCYSVEGHISCVRQCSKHKKLIVFEGSLLYVTYLTSPTLRNSGNYLRIYDPFYKKLKLSYIFRVF